MNINQYSWSKEKGWNTKLSDVRDDSSQLVFVFGDREQMDREGLVEELSSSFPKASLVGCSTAGEIIGTEVLDESLAVSAISFEKSKIRVESVELEGVGGSFGAGKKLAARLASPDLKHILIVSAGLDLNGSDLVDGITSVVSDSVSVSGGLAGDGTRFEKTLVLDRERKGQNLVVGIGLYGNSLEICSSSFGGWIKFGHQRLVTKAEGNVLYELDNQSALELYKKYLGPHASDLPASGLLFPLSIEKDGERLVRTILAVDEEEQSITFAGDIPQGAIVQLMRANNEELIDGAISAAEASKIPSIELDSGFAFLVSCVGRKLVLKQRTEEEIEAVRDVLGENISLFGFYSYGELSPSSHGGSCQLHNQTMTITVVSEKS